MGQALPPSLQTLAHHGLFNNSPFVKTAYQSLVHWEVCPLSPWTIPILVDSPWRHATKIIAEYGGFGANTNVSS